MGNKFHVETMEVMIADGKAWAVGLVEYHVEKTYLFPTDTPH